MAGKIYQQGSSIFFCLFLVFLFFFTPSELCNQSRALKPTFKRKNASNVTSNVRAMPK